MANPEIHRVSKILFDDVLGNFTLFAISVTLAPLNWFSSLRMPNPLERALIGLIVRF